MAGAAAHYRDSFGFELRHEEAGFALLVRDDAEIHLWAASDDDWRSRADFAENPVCSGAESFIAGTASCRIEAADVDGLFGELEAAGVLHPTSTGGPVDTDYGTREFHTGDRDGNLITFYRRQDPSH